jgi:hypothetical protein
MPPGVAQAAECPVCFAPLVTAHPVFACRRHLLCGPCTRKVLSSDEPLCPLCRSGPLKPHALLQGCPSSWWRHLTPLLQDLDIREVVSALDGVGDVEASIGMLRCFPPMLVVRHLEGWSDLGPLSSTSRCPTGTHSPLPTAAPPCGHPCRHKST